jgi:hypothetical protein
LPGIQAFHRRNLVSALLDQISNAVKDLAAPFGRGGSPRWESLAGSCDGLLKLLFAGIAGMSYDLTRPRLQHVERDTFARNGATGDEMTQRPIAQLFNCAECQFPLVVHYCPQIDCH